uniref:hypothetical protein n=1 Tax=uncultured Sphingomonas sp. TaxID=158754 RepID=UPI0025F44D54|nr:hypothetical protein [uncultured Sphingomonas sp.]
MITLVAAAAAFSAPVPLDQNTWFVGFRGQPKEGPFTVVASEITVNQYGYVEGCRAQVAVGMPAWAPFTCALIKRRARFQPARIAGRRTFGVFRLRTLWSQGGPLPEDKPTWDFVIPLSTAPIDLEPFSVTKIAFAVDANGRIQGCGAKGSWKHPELANIACAALPQKLAIEPTKDRRGKPMDSVQDAAVRFVGAQGTQR